MTRSLMLLALSLLATPVAAQEISAQRLSDITRELASPEYYGRAPGGPGEQKTVDYIISQFKALGLEPAGDNGGWTQTTPLVKFQTQPNGVYGLKVGGWSQALQQQADLRVETQRPVEHVSIKDAPIVFIGYGVSAPERGWDDFKGVDLKGKIAMVLINDPDFEALPTDPVAGKFGGRAATYYARWTYKYEEAARRGALGMLIVHETAGAAYGWSTVIAAGGGSYDIERADPARDKLLLQGWIHRDRAVELFRQSGLDFEAEKVRARTAGFTPVILKNATFSAEYDNRFTKTLSQNVLARLTGSKRPDETVLFAAHWDAYGQDPADPTGKTIRPGAADDAVGVAAVIETARALAAGPRPQRTTVFAAWTAEESGLLGSEYYAQTHADAFPKMAANYTFDVLQLAGPAHDMVLVGSGQNNLEQDLARVATRYVRTITPDLRPERALFYRADHFSLAKRGVPTALFMGVSGGANLINGGQAAGDRWVEEYTARCYHQACDSWSPDQDYRGAAADAQLALDSGRDLANSTRWPVWNASSEFRMIRERSAGARK